ncbi:MAG: methylase [Fibrobacteres bacterium]|nr:methylase [Fibrobacterota bacterium]
MQPEQEKRYWQNWDNGEASRKIDAYWIQSENPWRETLVRQLKRNFKPGDGIFEVGCGSGLIFHKMREHGLVDAKSYQGGDISQEMLKLARGRTPDVNFRTTDIFNIDMLDASQANVINIHVLQHLPGYEQPVKELMRIARDKLYIACWFHPGMEDQVHFSDPSENWDKQAFHNNTYSMPRFLAFLFANAPRPIVDLRMHHFGDTNYGITVLFREEEESARPVGRSQESAIQILSASPTFASVPAPLRENLAALHSILSRMA